MTIQSRANALSTQLKFGMCVAAIYVENERSRSRSPRGSECCSADSQNETEVGERSRKPLHCRDCGARRCPQGVKYRSAPTPCLYVRPLSCLSLLRPPVMA